MTKLEQTRRCNLYSMRNILVIIFTVALFLRLIAVISFGDRTLEHEFDILVHNILTGNGYSYFSVNQSGEICHKVIEEHQKPLPSAYIPPGYPLFLAAICALFGISAPAIILIEILQAFLGAFCCILLYKLVRTKFSEYTAVVSSTIFCLYPILIYVNSQISAANLYVFLNLLFLLLILKAEKSNKIIWFGFAGLVSGILVLSKTDMLILFPFVLIWLFIRNKRSRVKNVFTFAITTLVIVLVWTYRNHKVLGYPIPLTTSVGYNIWLGQNENATGTRGEYTDPPFTESSEIWEQIHAITPGRDYELQLNKVYLNEALSFMRNNPVKVIVLALKKFMFYWGHYWGIKFTYPHANSPLYWLPWFIILPFFIVGLFTTSQHCKKYMLFYLYFILTTIMAMLFFVIPRYRLLILPIILPFAVDGFLNLLRTHRNTPFKSTP